MKKKHFAIVCIMLALASCKKDPVKDQTNSTTSYFVDYDAAVNVSSFNYSDGTKHKWKAGDLIYVWFDSNISKRPDLALKYVGTNWVADRTIPVSGAKPSETGYYKAVHMSNGTDIRKMNPETSGDYLFLMFPNEKNGLIRLPLVLDAREQNYSFDAETKVLSMEINDWLVHTEMRLFVENDDNKMSASYPIAGMADGSPIRNSAGIVIDKDLIAIAMGMNEKILGFAEEGGVAFYIDGVPHGETDIHLTLTESGGETKAYTLPKFKTVGLSSMVNVKVKHSDFK